MGVLEGFAGDLGGLAGDLGGLAGDLGDFAGALPLALETFGVAVAASAGSEGTGKGSSGFGVSVAELSAMRSTQVQDMDSVWIIAGYKQLHQKMNVYPKHKK